MLYTKEEKFHKEFLNSFIPFVEKLDMSENQHRIASQWLYSIPTLYFEEFFLQNKDGSYNVPLLKDYDIHKPQEAAFYTQAFILFYLEQLLNTSPEYIDKFGFDIPSIESLPKEVCGLKNQTLLYLSQFRETLDPNKLVIPPQDWPLQYYDGLCDILYSSEDKISTATSSFNNMLSRMEFANDSIVYIVTKINNVKKYTDSID